MFIIVWLCTSVHSADISTQLWLAKSTAYCVNKLTAEVVIFLLLSMQKYCLETRFVSMLHTTLAREGDLVITEIYGSNMK